MSNYSIAIIPARSGSKRLPGKMVKPLLGKTLVIRAIETAMESGCFDGIIVSSDSGEILEQALAYHGIEARYRPAPLAADDATNMQLLLSITCAPELHQLHKRCLDRNLAGVLTTGATRITLLQPTSPFREAADIRQTINLLVSGVDAAVSLVEAPISPQRCFAYDPIASRCLVPPDSALLSGTTRAQSMEARFTPNGAVYVSTVEHIQRHRSFFAGITLGYIMPRQRSLDIDDAYDWRLAECFAAELG